jgi:hypothetical protein
MKALRFGLVLDGTTRLRSVKLGAVSLAVVLCFLLASLLSVPAWADTASAKTATPGTLNYVEGQASIGDQALNSQSVGTVELQPGQQLTTDTGKAEVLLTPGVFLRVGDHSSVAMISPSLTNTEVGLVSGHATVEVDQIFPENNIRVTEDGTTTRLLKTGLYDFDQRYAALRVFDGQAIVYDEGKNVTVKSGHEMRFTPDAKLKAASFDKKEYQEDDLYRWSSLRSAYVAEANVNAAGLYANQGYGPWGPGWWGAGWYWDPWFSAFTFIPGDGIFYSPFGWGFYSPWLVGYAPFYGYGFGYPYRPFYHHFSTDYHAWGGPTYLDTRNYAHGIYSGPGSTMHGFQSGPRMVGSAGAFGGGGVHGGAVHAGFGGHAGGFSGGGSHGGGSFGGGHGR